jgi:hypothetical protein
MAVSGVSTNSAVWNAIATEIESRPIASIREKVSIAAIDWVILRGAGRRLRAILNFFRFG